MAGLPAGKHGRGRLVVHGGDREAAKQLVDSIVRPASPYPSGPFPRGDDPRSLEPMADLLKLRMKLVGPAVGLLLAGILALVFSVVWGTFHIGKSFAEGFSSVHPVLALWALPVAAMAAVLLTGAIRMVKQESYFFAVIAAVLALLPWSPAWVLGLPCGLWALIVLSKPEVMAAFLGDQRGRVGGVPDAQGSQLRAGGKFRSFFRSVGGYLLTRFSERRSFSEVPAGKVAEPPQPLAPTPPLAPTADYSGEPPAPPSEHHADGGI